MAQSPIKVGVIGTGGMAATMVQAMQSFPGLMPVTVLSNEMARAQRFAESFGLAGAFDTPEAFFAESKCSAIYIANSNVAHAEMARASIDAGLPALIEKPLSLSVSDTQSIYAAAQAAGVLVAENLWTMTLPAYHAFKAEALSGGFGGPRCLSFDFSLPVDPKTYPGLFKAEGGGVLLDRAVYGFAMACDLLGPVIELDADVVTNECGVDIRSVLMLRHEGGARSILSVSLDYAGRNDACLSLETGVLELKHGLAAEHLTMMHQPVLSRGENPGGVVGLKQRLKENQTLRRLKGLFVKNRSIYHGYGINPYHPVLSEFANALRAGQTELASVPRSLSLQVADLVAQAKERGGRAN